MSTHTATTMGAARRLARDTLRASGVEAWAADAELLLDALTDLPRTRRLAEPDLPCPDGERLGVWLARRVAGEPVPYVTGQAWFAGLLLSVDCNVLIPRPETEVVLAEALRRRLPGAALDIGTGSGALALGLASAGARPVFAVDVSSAALDVARRNATRLGLEVEFRHGDLLAPVRDAGPFGVVVANLPYVDATEWRALPVDVREHEPRIALVPPDGDGLGLVRRLLSDVPAVLASGAWLLAEIDATHGARAAALARAAGAVEVEVAPDLARRDRVLAARFS